MFAEGVPAGYPPLQFVVILVLSVGWGRVYEDFLKAVGMVGVRRRRSRTLSRPYMVWGYIDIAIRTDSAIQVENIDIQEALELSRLAKITLGMFH